MVRCGARGEVRLLLLFFTECSLISSIFQKRTSETEHCAQYARARGTIWHFGLSRNLENRFLRNFESKYDEHCIFRYDLLSFYKKEKVTSLFDPVGFFEIFPRPPVIIIITKYLYRAISSVVILYTKLYSIYALLSWRPCKT